jgi:hypothetical protein
MNTYSVQGLLVGPYLPSKDVTIGDVRITRSDTPLKWETPKSPISAEPGAAQESLITFTPNKITVDTHAQLLWEGQAVSSKQASEIASKAFAAACNALCVACFATRYFFQISSVTKTAGGADPESPLSEALHVVSYESSALNSDLEAYANAIHALTDTDAFDIVQTFGESLRRYKTFGLYMVMEKITHVLSSEVKAARSMDDVEKEKATAITELQELLNDAAKSPKDKEKAIKKSSEDLKRLNLEQNGKRIAATAEYLGIKGEGAKMIDRAIKYRNTTLAHHNPGTTEDAKGVEEIQESARFFVISYLKKAFGISLPKLPDVKYQDFWYKVSYVNSRAKELSPTED